MIATDLDIEAFAAGSIERTNIRAALHDAALAYRESNAFNDRVPRGKGYVIFWRGQGCGWTLSIDGNPHGWLADCVAVPVDPAGTCYVARDGNYTEGAERWEALAA